MTTVMRYYGGDNPSQYMIRIWARSATEITKLKRKYVGYARSALTVAIRLRVGWALMINQFSFQ